MKIIEKALMKDLTTIKVGGGVKAYIEVANVKELEEIVIKAKMSGEEIFVLGGGSDILVSDKGIDALVLKFTGSHVKFTDKGETVEVQADAGLVWDALVNKCVEKNLQGIECLSGIPGTVGAAPVQNIGAYGQELKDTFKELLAFNVEKEEFVTFSKAECRFAYRESVFKTREFWQKFVIVSITLVLEKDAEPAVLYESLRNYLLQNNIQNPSLQEVRDAVLAIRKTKFEDYNKVPNAGSFFKNPIIDKHTLERLKADYPEIPYFESSDSGAYKLFAGWLIEKSGWKGRKLGNAQVSPSHALVLINPEEKAKAVEISNLAREIIDDVERKFGVKLEKEVQFVGF